MSKVGRDLAQLLLRHLERVLVKMGCWGSSVDTSAP